MIFRALRDLRNNADPGKDEFNMASTSTSASTSASASASTGASTSSRVHEQQDGTRTAGR
jgi:hypothetical protein